MPRRRDDRPSVPQVLALASSVARKSRVTGFEAFAVLTANRRVTVEGGIVSGADSILSTGLHIRVSEGRSVGGAYCNTFDGREVARCLSEARKIARITEPDDNWCGFPAHEGRYRHVDGLYDRSVASLGLGSLSRFAEDMISGSSASGEGVSATYGAVEALNRSVGVTNSSGVEAVYKETELRGTVACVAGEGASVTPECLDLRMSRSPDVDFERVGSRAGWAAAKSSNIVEPRTEKCEVVFSPMSLGEEGSGLLSALLRKAFSGQNVARGVSFLADRVGEAMWPESITIDDSPQLAARCGSRPFDDEGMPTSRTRLVHKGRLTGFVWDSYHGAVSGEGSSGNAVRDAVTGAVRAAPLCMRFAPGRGTLEKSVSSLDHGYLVWGCQGAHTSNPETGGFSFVANPAMLIENGEVVGGVRGVMVSGNVTDLMANVESVGSDSVDFGCTLMPSMVFRDVNITTG